MKIICRQPRTGKTAKMIMICAENGGYIVCKDKQTADYTFKLAKKLGVSIPFPMTFDELIGQKYHARGVGKVYIDNADMLLQKIARGLDVAAVTMDEQEVEWNNNAVHGN